VRFFIAVRSMKKNEIKNESGEDREWYDVGGGTAVEGGAGLVAYHAHAPEVVWVAATTHALLDPPPNHSASQCPFYLGETAHRREKRNELPGRCRTAWRLLFFLRAEGGEKRKEERNGKKTPNYSTAHLS
jgi:hypothetical protein